MIHLLEKLWILKVPEGEKRRNAYGIACGALGIFLNLCLFVIKFLAGKISGSIAIVADAFNNLSDAGSSLITLLGFRLAAQKPDPEHPFGHGRFEYLSGLAVSAAILLMGAELIKSSAEKILHPESVEFSVLTAAILVLAICVKLYMYLYNRGVGEKVQSAAMKATAADSFSDSLATTMVLAAMLISHFLHLQIDGVCGLIVAVIILISGWKAMKDTLDPLLGQAPDEEFVKQIRDITMSHSYVLGMHDLVVHDYGPNRCMISLHVEVPGSGDIFAVHDEIDHIEQELQEKLHCHAVIHMDPVDNDDRRVKETKEAVTKIIEGLDKRLTLHDFRMVWGPTHTNLIFDLLVPYDMEGSVADWTEKVTEAIKKENAAWCPVIHGERPYSQVIRE